MALSFPPRNLQSASLISGLVCRAYLSFFGVRGFLACWAERLYLVEELGRPPQLLREHVDLLLLGHGGEVENIAGGGVVVI